jgi:hypothetical protein
MRSIIKEPRIKKNNNTRNVKFGPPLSPELFDKDLPPDMPVKRGSVPQPPKIIKGGYNKKNKTNKKVKKSKKSRYSRKSKKTTKKSIKYKKL